MLFIQSLIFGLCWITTALADQPGSASVKKPFLPNKIEIELPKVVILAGQPIEAAFSFTLPTKHHLNLEAPSRVVLTSPGSSLSVTSPIKSLSHSLTVPARELGSGQLEFSTSLYYCEDGNTTLCKIRGLAITQPYEAKSSGVTALSISASVPD